MLEDYLDKIICGDCLEVMKELPDGCVDAVVTDPPYGVGKADWDVLPKGALKEAFRLCRDYMLVFWSSFDLSKIPDEVGKGPKNIIVWHKPNLPCLYMWDKARLSSQWEAIFYFAKPGYKLPKHGSDVLSFKYPVNSPSRLHPTQKPVALIKKLLDIFQGDVILDPFLGSGTTAVACKETGRHFIGIELEEKYCEIARRRVAETSEPLFVM